MRRPLTSGIVNDLLHFFLVYFFRYRESVKKYSDKYRDRIASALDTAVFWVEYVLKHHGAPHLQYPGKQLNFFQRHSLDVLGLFFVIFFVIYKFFAFLFGLCCGKKSKIAQVKADKKKK